MEKRERLALAFWRFALRAQGHFGTALGLRPQQLGGALRIRELGPTSSLVSTPVPTWCTSPRDGRVQLGAVVAMLDEISTYAGTVQWDRGARPGVSVQLEGRALRPLDVGPGDMLSFETRLRKIGKTIGFVDIVVRDERSGADLVRASHVKFMPMGAAFDALLRWREQTLPAVESLLAMRAEHHVEEPQSIAQVFPMMPLDEGAAGPKTWTMEASALHGNPIGSIHGGAAVMASIRAAELAAGVEGETPLAVRTNLMAGVPTGGTKRSTLRATCELDPTDAHRARVTLSHRGGPTADSEVSYGKALFN